MVGQHVSPRQFDPRRINLKPSAMKANPPKMRMVSALTVRHALAKAPQAIAPMPATPAMVPDILICLFMFMLLYLASVHDVIDFGGEDFELANDCHVILKR